MQTNANMATLEILQRARAQIAKPEQWCRGFYSRNGAHCALGAILSVMNGDIEIEGYAVAAALMEAVNRPMGEHEGAWVSVLTYNDRHTHGDVLAMFDGAIANLEAA